MACWRLREASVGILAALWLWLGGVFLWLFQRTIDTGPGPVLFTAAFILQGGLLLWAGVFQGQMHFGAKLSGFTAMGWLLIVYAMLVYPLLGIASGHVYPRQPMSGVAPCPTTIFTFGVLLLTTTRVPKYLLAIPLVWSLISRSQCTVELRGVRGRGLLFAGVVGSALLIWRDRQRSLHSAMQPRHA